MGPLGNFLLLAPKGNLLGNVNLLSQRIHNIKIAININNDDDDDDDDVEKTMTMIY